MWRWTNKGFAERPAAVSVSSDTDVSDSNLTAQLTVTIHLTGIILIIITINPNIQYHYTTSVTSRTMQQRVELTHHC